MSTRTLTIALANWSVGTTTVVCVPALRVQGDYRSFAHTRASRRICMLTQSKPLNPEAIT
jgi:hypothetical protein